MEHNTNKERWIDEVMNSTQGMSRAQPGAGLYEQITAKLTRPQTATTSFPVKRWAAAAILLLTLNVGSVIYFNNREKKATNISTSNPLASEIQTETIYNY